MGITGTQDRRHQVLLGFVVEGEKADYGQVAPGVVMAIEERQLLRAVRGIVGRIQIDGDPPRSEERRVGKECRL